MLFEATTRNFPLHGAGDVAAFTDYDVHYVGQAFSQKVWERLTGHTNLQSVLSTEFVRGERVPSAALEISLITLEIFGVTEFVIDASRPFPMPEGVTPIIHEVGADEIPILAALETVWMKPEDAEATNELEAMLIDMFDPPYNTIKYKEYPYIKRGGRSKGYSLCDVFLTDFPFRLRAQDGTEPLEDV
jgi:hypothetical protein